MTRVVGVGLLASAFAPLVALLAILKLHHLRWVGWLVLAACLAAFLLLALVLRSLAGYNCEALKPYLYDELTSAYWHSPRATSSRW